MDKGLIINGEKMSNLRFADDVAVLFSSIIELENMIKELENKGMDSG